MSLLIKNCNLISMSDDRDKYEEGIDILIENNKISKIGNNLETDGEVIDAKGKVALPGLINTHTHLPMSIFRETVDGYKTHDWLEKVMWPLEDKLVAEDVYWASKLSCIEMIKTGTTTANDMYFFTDSIIKAALDTGVRLQTTRCLVGNSKYDVSRINELKDILARYNEENISFNLGIHGLYTCNEEYVEKCIDLAEENNLHIHMHFCENQQEREETVKIYNVGNPSEVIKNSFRGIHNVLAHCVKITNEDINILKDTNTYISHCPISNLKLGCGLAPIDKLISNGICVSLGTDGQGSGSNLDMFETMKATALLQKGINENPELMPAYEVLKMATINGAKALKLDDKIGTIEEGKIADLIIIDINEILSRPVNNIFAELVYNTKGYDVDTTIVNGKVLMKNKIVKQNVDDVILNCERVVERIK
ncbi:MAG: amidohydrolase [Clostridia bacterium]|nr:amidohydrolase [Clostridia bacterium]